MALVFPHEGPGEGIIGKFLGDGLEYLACIRNGRFIDFYLFPECYTKCKTIEVCEKGKIDPFYDLKLYSMSPTLDYLVINGETCKYWNTTELIDLEGTFDDMSFSGINVAPGLFVNGKNQVRKENEVIFSREPIDEAYATVSLLDEDTIAIFDKLTEEDEGQLEIFSIKSNRVLSKWTFELSLLEHGALASYVSKYDRSKVLIFFQTFKDTHEENPYVLDISQLKAQDTQYSGEEMWGVQNEKLLFYDDATGAPVFKSYEYITPSTYELILRVFRNEEFSQLTYRGKLKDKYIFLNSNVYEIVADSNKEVQLCFKTSLPSMARVEHTYRDLAGTVYLDVNGVFRESLTFTTSCVLSNEAVEPVMNIFWVGESLILLSGKENCVVKNISTKMDVDSWYRGKGTVFASEKFQVCGSKLCTEDKEMDLPFLDAHSFALSRTSIVIGSTKQVAIISQDLQTTRIIEDESIIKVFSEGYICKSGVKFFKTPEGNIQANGIVSAQLVDNALFTVSAKGELRSGAYQESVELMLEGVDFLSASGDKMLISGTNDTYIYSKGEYVSIEAGDYDTLLVSDDKRVCISLLEGVVYLKSNVGFRMVKKKVGGMLDYGSLSVCNDKLMCCQANDFAMENEVIVKFITKNVTHRFRKYPNNLVLFSGTHFISTIMEDYLQELCSLSNPEDEDSYETFLLEYPEPRTLPSLVSDNRVFVFGNSSWMIFESINGEEIQRTESEEVNSENGLYKLGYRPSDYPRSGDHWIVYFDDDGKDKIHLIPKSQKSIIMAEYQGFIRGPYCDWISAIPSETNPDVYYCATSEEVYKVSVDGTQERIATLKFDQYRNCKYTVNHGSKTKYEPDFIITDGHPTTITILQPSEAEILAAVQKELIRDSEKAEVVSEIDGKFLLAAVMDSKNEALFTKHGIDSEELKKDLFELFK